MKTGRYVTESEAVADGLAELRARTEIRQVRMMESREKVQVGLDQLGRGQRTEWNAEEIKAKGRGLLGARKSSVD